MDKLTELYAKRKVLEEFGYPIPESLAAQIKAAEKELLDSALEMFSAQLPSEIDVPNCDRIVFVAKYAGGRLAQVAASSTLNLADMFDSVLDIPGDEALDSDEPEDDNPADDDPGSGRKRGPNVKFGVKFADGKLIKCSTIRRTLVEVLRYMGLERASKYRGRLFAGYPLVGKEQRPTEGGHIWQKNVDGWWVYVHMGASAAMPVLKEVAEMLGMGIEIIMDDDSVNAPQTLFPTSKPKSRRRQFSINGSEPLAKNRAVYEAVRLFLQEFPDSTFADIEEMFPRELQGSYGVIRTMEDIRSRMVKNTTESVRWFLEPEEILTAADGTQFVVCTEWDENNFDLFKRHIESSFGWKVDEA